MIETPRPSRTRRLLITLILIIATPSAVLDSDFVRPVLSQTGITCEPAISLGGPATLEADPGTTVTIPYTASVVVANTTFVDLSVAIGQPEGTAIVYSPTNQTFQTTASPDPQTRSLAGEISARIPDDAVPGTTYAFDQNSAQATCFGPDAPDGITTTAFGNMVEVIVAGQVPTPTEPPPPTATPEPSPTPTPQPSPTPAETPTPEPTATGEPTPTPTEPATPTEEPEATETATTTGTPEVTATEAEETPTAAPDDATATATAELEATATLTATATATSTLEPTATEPRTQTLVLDITESRIGPDDRANGGNPLLRLGLAMLGLILAVSGGYAVARSRQ